MKPNKNLVIELSTSAYELMKQTIIDFLNRVTDDLQLQLAFEEEKVLDENGDNVETRYKVVNRKLDGNPGKISKLTINCYHTTSRILVNGSRVELFVNMFPGLKRPPFFANYSLMVILIEKLIREMNLDINRVIEFIFST